MRTAKDDPSPVTVNAETAARLLGVSRSSIFGLLANKSIPSLVIAGRRVIRYGDLLTFVDQQAEASDPKAEARVARAVGAGRSKRRSSPVGKSSLMEQA